MIKQATTTARKPNQCFHFVSSVLCVGSFLFQCHVEFKMNIIIILFWWERPHVFHSDKSRICISTYYNIVNAMVHYPLHDVRSYGRRNMEHTYMKWLLCSKLNWSYICLMFPDYNTTAFFFLFSMWADVRPDVMRNKIWSRRKKMGETYRKIEKNRMDLFLYVYIFRLSISIRNIYIFIQYLYIENVTVT